MDIDIPTIETARVALFHKKAIDLAEKLDATQTACAQTAEKIADLIRAVNKQGVLPEHAKQLIGEAVADVAAMIKDEPTWEARYKKMADDVHFNGYAALAEIVDLKKEDIERRFSQALEEAFVKVDLQIGHLKDAVAGGPPLPVLPPDAKLGKKLGWYFATAAVRFQRWCISALPMLVFFGVVLLLVVALLLGIALAFRHFL
ncbi:hypothetical protein LJR267_010474 [Paraburkholderia hospita]|jgi:hypothetical protein|uniref:hypothetical protein n=1 Tax=Paraburkholderia hospita TaxID=169430 RepID=UPI003ED00856